MNTECPELNNIKYKTMLLNGNKNNIKSTTADNISNIEAFLEKECENNKCEPWSKLDKTMKISRLNDYADTISKDFKLTNAELKSLKKYLSVCLDKKKLQRIKDVQYEKETGKILNIANLQFNKVNRKFTLKRDQKRVSTLKSLSLPKASKFKLNPKSKTTPNPKSKTTPKSKINPKSKSKTKTQKTKIIDKIDIN